MEFIEKGKKACCNLTAEKAQDIYSRMKTHGNVDIAFKETDDYHNREYKQVDKEADRIKSEVYSNMVTDKPSTIEDLISLISSDLLDVQEVCEDVVAWYGGRGFSEPTTWEDFVASFEIGDI
jgi:hypothetical protein